MLQSGVYKKIRAQLTHIDTSQSVLKEELHRGVGDDRRHLVGLHLFGRISSCTCTKDHDSYKPVERPSPFYPPLSISFCLEALLNL